MNKKTQMWLGVAAIGVAGYFLWKKSQEQKSFANVAGGSMGLGQKRCRYNSDCDYSAPFCAGASANQRGYCIRRSGTISSATF